MSISILLTAPAVTVADWLGLMNITDARCPTIRIALTLIEHRGPCFT